MSTLGLAANHLGYDATRRPVASPCRASSRPRGLDVDTGTCVRCGATFYRPSYLSRSAFRRRRYCTVECYRSREPEPIADRFWRHVAKGDGCWEWTAARSVDGYGVFGVDRETMRRASRIAWDLTFGPIPDGLWVLHHCDNPPCVRPDHLFLGNVLANVRDMDRKGRRVSRGQPGETNSQSKLTEVQVREIRRRREAGERPKALAAEFGVSTPLISYICKRKAWSHVA